MTQEQSSQAYYATQILALETRVDYLENQNKSLNYWIDRARKAEIALAESQQTVEDVALGCGITCIRCGKDTRWCKCNE